MTRAARRNGTAAVLAAAALPVGLVTVVMVLWLRGSQAAVGGPYGQFISDVGSGELAPGRCVGQSFVADMAGLNRIEVLLATFGRTNHGPLILHVKAAPFAAGDMATVVVDMADLVDNQFHVFTFEPLPLPAGVPAFFCLEAPASSPGNTVMAWAQSADLYAGGQAQLASGEPLAGTADLAFRLYYQPGWRLAAEEALRRLAADKPGPLRHPWLYTGLATAYLALLAALGWVVGRAALEAQARLGTPADPDGESPATEP